MSEPLSTVLVDDAADVRALVRAQLEIAGGFAVVGEGATGVEAVALAREHQPALVVLDVSMPDMDGLEALALVREASPGTTVVMFSGFAAPELHDRARQAGAADFVEKTIAIAELPARLERAVRSLVAVSEPEPEPTPDVLHSMAGDVLTEHQERFRAVFDRATIGMATATLTGSIVRANAALADLLSLDPDALVGASFLDFAGAEMRAQLLDARDRVVAGKADSASVEFRVVTNDPAPWVRSSVGVVRDSQQRPLYLLLQFEDVTTTKLASEALRESEERFRLLVESVVDYAIFLLDADGHVASWNSGAQRINGYTAAEIMGRHFRAFYLPDAQASRHPERELEIAARDGRYEEEGWRVRNDGSQFWATVVITALRSAAGDLVGFAKVTRDITDRHTVAVERERASVELAQANRLLQSLAQERADFLAVTAHELQSPVAAISGAAQVLRDYAAQLDDVERARTVGAIMSSTNRMRRLIDDLLVASRLDAGALDVANEPVGLVEVLEDVVSLAGVPVTINAGDPVTVCADRGRVGQMVSNLVANATTYGAAPIVIDVSVAGAAVEVRVRDHGGGVPDELIPRLFTKFSRGTSGRGTGLGLYIVRELARAQGGDAWYERSGAGAVFVLRLPTSA